MKNRNVLTFSYRVAAFVVASFLDPTPENTSTAGTWRASAQPDDPLPVLVCSPIMYTADVFVLLIQ